MLSAKANTGELRNTCRGAQSLTRPCSTLIITHTPLTTTSPMRSGPSELSGKCRSSLHVGDAVHQGRTGRVVDVPFTRETAAVRDERSGLAVILVGFGSLRVEGTRCYRGRALDSIMEGMGVCGDSRMQRVRPFHLHVRRNGREQGKSEYEFGHGSFR